MGRDRRVEYISSSPEDTLLIGRKLADLAVHSIICFFGDLGAGKTTLIKGFIEKATATPLDEIISPTFVYMNQYLGQEQKVYHFDLYRLQDAYEFVSLGFDDYLYSGDICLIEWSEKIAPLIPPQHISVHMAYLGEEERKITIILNEVHA